MKKFALILSLFLTYCSSPSDEQANRPEEWQGKWFAEWETSPDAYEGIFDMEFYMNGIFEFSDDSLTVTVNGYPGCIFGTDTLSHTQLWKIKSDTLFLMNDPKVPGMTYRIVGQDSDRIKLQLVEDIFVTLQRQ